MVDGPCLIGASPPQPRTSHQEPPNWRLASMGKPFGRRIAAAWLLVLAYLITLGASSWIVSPLVPGKSWSRRVDIHERSGLLRRRIHPTTTRSSIGM